MRYDRGQQMQQMLGKSAKSLWEAQHQQQQREVLAAQEDARMMEQQLRQDKMREEDREYQTGRDREQFLLGLGKTFGLEGLSQAQEAAKMAGFKGEEYTPNFLTKGAYGMGQVSGQKYEDELEAARKKAEYDEAVQTQKFLNKDIDQGFKRREVSTKEGELERKIDADVQDNIHAYRDQAIRLFGHMRKGMNAKLIADAMSAKDRFKLALAIQKLSMEAGGDIKKVFGNDAVVDEVQKLQAALTGHKGGQVLVPPNQSHPDFPKGVPPQSMPGGQTGADISVSGHGPEAQELLMALKSPGGAGARDAVQKMLLVDGPGLTKLMTELSATDPGTSLMITDILSTMDMPGAQ